LTVTPAWLASNGLVCKAGYLTPLLRFSL